MQPAFCGRRRSGQPQMMLPPMKSRWSWRNIITIITTIITIITGGIIIGIITGGIITGITTTIDESVALARRGRSSTAGARQEAPG
jgi:MFS superfamily sulfate permease-like transporter